MSEHWLQHARGRIVAGDLEPDVLADYGWVQITDEEREAIEVAAAAYAADHGERFAAVLRKLRERRGGAR